MKINMALILPLVLIGGVSCGPTTETIEAPFKLTSDFSSSTSGGTALLDPSVRAHQRLEQFVAHAYDGVGGDIAQGHGEYLTSLAVLAGIPTDLQPAFQRMMQNRYAEFYTSGLSHEEVRTLVVNHAWSAGYGHNGKKQTTSAASGL